MAKKQTGDDSTVNESKGQFESPFENPYNPYGNPYENASNPYYNPTTPYYNPTSPYYNPTSPYANPNNPYANAKNPYANAKNPYNPYNPYGNNLPPQDDEGGMNINVLEWLIRFLHYWYLFLIAAVIAFSLAYLKNRKWIPQRLSSCTIVIKESNQTGTQQALLQGFAVGAGYTNVNNQMIMLGSYDLVGRVVDSIPFLNVEYITQGRFKTRNLYRMTPIVVEYESVNNSFYDMLFRCTFKDDGTLIISSEDEDVKFTTTAHYGERIESPYFTATIWPTENMVRTGHIFFRFRHRSALIDEFLSRLTLNFVTEGSTVLRISLIGETPERDCEFLDKLQDIYLLQNLERKNAVAENSINFINSQLDVLQSSLSLSEGAMTDFRQENKFVDVNSYAGQLMSRVSAYDQERMALRLKETYLDYLANYLKEQIEDGTVVAPASLGLNEPMLMSQVQQLNDLMLQRSELSTKNVYYAKYTNDIENVKAAISEVVRQMRASLEIEKKDLHKRYADVEQEIQKLPEKELQMVAIERNYRIDDNYYTFFLQKRAESEIQKASNTPDNDIMDRARTSIVTNAKQKSKTMSTYLIIGFLIPFLLIILSEILNDKVRTPGEAEKLVKDFHLIGTIRHAKNQNPMLVKTNPRSRYAEMLRSIRTRVEFIVQRKEKFAICITSTESGDGKTFLATNLAALYAMTGKKTILIDMDIRKPNIHTKLGLKSGLGVTNYLIDDCTLEDIIDKNTPFDFDFVRAGTVPPNPGELIHSDKMSEMLKILREEYDYIIVDSSPIGQVPDAYSLIEQTDTTLYVVRCLQTSKSFCKQTLEQLAVDHGDKIHLILSDMPTEGYARGYNYGYAYHYGARYGYGYGGKAAGSYGQYGYGYGRYGYANHRASKKDNWRYKYGYYYGKIFRKKEDASRHYDYYMDDDE